MVEFQVPFFCQIHFGQMVFLWSPFLNGLSYKVAIAIDRKIIQSRLRISHNLLNFIKNSSSYGSLIRPSLGLLAMLSWILLLFWPEVSQKHKILTVMSPSAGFSVWLSMCLPVRQFPRFFSWNARGRNVDFPISFIWVLRSLSANQLRSPNRITIFGASYTLQECTYHKLCLGIQLIFLWF